MKKNNCIVCIFCIIKPILTKYRQHAQKTTLYKNYTRLYKTIQIYKIYTIQGILFRGFNLKCLKMAIQAKIEKRHTETGLKKDLFLGVDLLCLK